MKKVIAIVGQIASGKDSFGEYLKNKYGIPTYTISSELKEIAKERNIEINRENLIELGIKVNEEFGANYLLKKILERFKDEEIISITGIRRVGKIKYLKENTDFVLIAIDSDINTRLARIRKRGKIGDPTNLAELRKIEEKEKGNGGVLNISECMKLADFTIENNSSLEEFYEKVDEIMREVL